MTTKKQQEPDPAVSGWNDAKRGAPRVPPYADKKQADAWLEGFDAAIKDSREKANKSMKEEGDGV